MSDTTNSSPASTPEIGSELGGSIWKAFRAQQLQATAWWERFTQQNAEATARDAWRSGAGQPDVTPGLFSRSATKGGDEDVINVDSPITNNHYPPPPDNWKTVATVGGVALAAMGLWQAPAIIDAMTSDDPTPTPPTNTVIERDYSIGEITVE